MLLNKKTTYAIVAVVIIIIVVGIAAYAVLNNKPGETEENSPTPTATSSVLGANSIEFNSNLTSQGVTIQHKWAGKDIHVETPTIRLDILGGESGNYSYMLDVGQQKSFTSINGGAWTPSTYATDWTTFGAEWTDYLNHMGHWTSGDVSYTNTAGEAVTLYNIVINPTIPDSTFATS